jgi:hypothetical protein
MMKQNLSEMEGKKRPISDASATNIRRRDQYPSIHVTYLSIEGIRSTNFPGN